MNEAEYRELLEKIKKLFNHAQGAEAIGSLEEAKNASMLAQQLLDKYNLSEEQVRAYTKPTGEQQNSFEGLAHKFYGHGRFWRKNQGEWRVHLIGVLAKFNFVEYTLTLPIQHHGITLYGELHNIELVYFFFEQLETVIINLARKTYQENSRNDVDFVKINHNRLAYNRHFCEGAVRGIGVTLALERQKYDVGDNAHSTSLVIQNKTERVVNYKYSVTGPLKSRSTRGLTASNSGYGEGYEQGRKIKINSGLSSNSSSGPKLLN